MICSMIRRFECLRDGSRRNGVDPTVFENLATKSGGEVVNDF
jgi:hypothetical protein